MNSRQAPQITAAPSGPELPSDWRGFVRLGWFVLLGGFGVFLVWAVFAPLDKGVPVPGTVIVAGQRLIVQSPNPGVVQTILIKEGARVSAGDLLLRMQPKIAEAATGASLSSYALALLTKERLLAELSSRTQIELPPVLKSYASEPAVQAQIAAQRQLLDDRLRAHVSEIAALDEVMRGLEQQRIALSESWQSKQRESRLLDDQAARTRSLVDKGFASAASLDEVELKRARLHGEIAENRGSLRRIEAQIDETRLTKDKRESEWRQDIKSKIAEAQRDIDNFKGQLGSAELSLSYMDVKAPVAGEVLGLLITTPGAVLSQGQKLLDIVPDARDLLVEAQIPVNLIDQVRPGLSVELMFSAFQLNKTPRLTGKIITVGADRVTDPRSGFPYYPVNIAIDQQSKSNLGANELRPGMPVDVFVKTGERTFVSYLLKPITDRLKSSLAEE